MNRARRYLISYCKRKPFQEPILAGKAKQITDTLKSIAFWDMKGSAFLPEQCVAEIFKIRRNETDDAKVYPVSASSWLITGGEWRELHPDPTTAVWVYLSSAWKHLSAILSSLWLPSLTSSSSQSTLPTKKYYWILLRQRRKKIDTLSVVLRRVINI